MGTGIENVILWSSSFELPKSPKSPCLKRNLSPEGDVFDIDNDGGLVRACEILWWEDSHAKTWTDRRDHEILSDLHLEASFGCKSSLKFSAGSPTY